MRHAGKVVAYVRVSSDSQNEATQRKAIQTAARARRDRIVEWFSDRRSGKKLARPDLDRLRRLVAAGEVRKLYCTELSRITRSGIRDTLGTIEEFRRVGCELVTLYDSFPMDGPAADVVIAVLAWCAQVERERIGQRISEARKRLEAEGRHWGRPRVIGPKVQREIRLGWEENEAAGEPMSLRDFAKRLKLSEATVRRVVRQKGPYGRTAKTTRKKG